MAKAADVVVQCLEDECVKYVFAFPAKRVIHASEVAKKTLGPSTNSRSASPPVSTIPGVQIVDITRRSMCSVKLRR